MVITHSWEPTAPGCRIIGFFPLARSKQSAARGRNQANPASGRSKAAATAGNTGINSREGKKELVGARRTQLVYQVVVERDSTRFSNSFVMLDGSSPCEKLTASPIVTLI